VDRFVHHLFLSLVITLAGAAGAWAQEDSAPAESAPADAAPAKDEPANADPSKPLVSMMMTNADEFFADLTAMMGEDKEAEEALEKIHIVLDPFLTGGNKKNPAMNTTKPFGLVIYLEESKLKTVFFFPVENTEAFFSGFYDVGIDSKKESGGFYKISGDIYEGFAREKEGYVYFGPSKEILLRSLASPEEMFKPFLEKKYDVAVLIEGDAETVEERRKAFKEFRKETVTAIEKQKEESELDFDIRKAVLEFQLDEMERILAESRRLELAWTLNNQTQKGKLHIDLEALPETSLAKTITVLEQTDGDARKNFPAEFDTYASSHFYFDDIRKEHLTKLLGLSRQKTEIRIQENEQIAEDDKANAKKVSDLMYSLLEANTAEGTLLGWVKGIKNEKSQNTFLGQMTVGDSADSVAKFEQSGVVEMKVDSVEGQADIHKMKLYGDFEGLKAHVGDDLSVFFATGLGDRSDRLWFAIGRDAVAQIKKAVEANEAESPVAAQYRVKLSPWIDALTDPEKKKPEEKPKASRRRPRGSRRSKREKKKTDVARIAWQVLGAATDDTLLGTMEKRDENRVELHSDLDSGIIKFIGQVIATEVNLQI